MSREEHANSRSTVCRHHERFTVVSAVSHTESLNQIILEASIYALSLPQVRSHSQTEGHLAAILPLAVHTPFAMPTTSAPLH